MAAILAQMGGDTVRSGSRGGMRCSHRIGMVPAARISDGRDMVDVDGEAQRLGHAATRLPGFVVGIAASSGGSESAA